MLRLELPSTPECGMLVRALLMGVGAALAWDGELIDDLKTAVTEACNNVAMHAYGGEAGKLVLRLAADRQWIEVVVCDEGEGLQGVSGDGDHLHVGLPVISTLAERAEFLSPPEGGTEVRMRFRAGNNAGPSPGARASWTAGVVELIDEPQLLGADLVGVVSPPPLLGAALGRLVRALAATSRFRLGSFSALRELTDTLGAHARAAASEQRIGFTLRATERQIELAAGPFQRGSGSVFTAQGLAHPASPLSELADQLRLEDIQGGEVVRLVISNAQ
jgi:serine/threonine-protein kinase RsbW